jgi:hypothetical protein
LFHFPKPTGFWEMLLNDDIPIILEDASLDTLIDRVKLPCFTVLLCSGYPECQ